MSREIAYRRLGIPALVIGAALYFSTPAVVCCILVDSISYRILGIIITAVCMTFACMSGVWIVRYFNNFGMLAKSFGGEVDLDIFLAGCRIRNGAYNFFTDDSLITFEKPAQIYYSDITELYTRKQQMVKRYSTQRRYHYEIFIKTLSGENYYFSHFNTGFSNDSEQNYISFILLLEHKNPKIRRGGAFPSSSEIFKAQFSQGGK